MGKKSKPKQLTWRVNAFKWKGFISLDCVWKYSFYVFLPDLESLNLFECLRLLLLLLLQNAIHYLQNQMHHVTPCYVWIPYVRIQFSRANLTSHSSRLFFYGVCVYFVYAYYALPILFSSFSNSSSSSSHSNYAAPVPPKLKHSNNHSTFFCTYIKHRNHFPHQTCIVSNVRATSIQCVYWSLLHSFTHSNPFYLSQFARISFECCVIKQTHIRARTQQNLILILFTGGYSTVAARVPAIYSSRFIQIT